MARRLKDPDHIEVCESRLKRLVVEIADAREKRAYSRIEFLNDEINRTLDRRRELAGTVVTEAA